MKSMLLYPTGTTDAVRYAVTILHKRGIPIIDHPAPEITHLLLDVPSFSPNGSLRDCGALERVLERLPQNITVIGGNLSHPALENYAVLDLLADETYLAHNAFITADCAIRVAAPLLKTTFADTPVLIIGWGRIGKCLAHMLHGLGTKVFVAARKEKERSLLNALGLIGVDTGIVPAGCRLIINTVPQPISLPETSCIKIDLASQKGLSGEDVLRAKGLPGIHTPESSGRLIAETILRVCREERK